MSDSPKIICHDINGNLTEVEAKQLTFRPSVYGVLIEDDKVLLSKQFDGYDFPGGGMDVDETIEQALKREFIEETGIEIEPIKPLICQTSFFNPNYSKKYEGQFWNCLVVYYLVRKVGGNIANYKLSEQEQHYADKPEWISLDNIATLKFYNPIDSKKLIRDAAISKK